MNKQKLIELCLLFDDAIATYPFKDDKQTCVIRHKGNNKWFGLIFYLDKKLYINTKCEPEIGAILKMQYTHVTPAWHMNKKHWIKTDPLKISRDVLLEIIKMSYDLTKPKKRRQRDLNPCQQNENLLS